MCKRKSRSNNESDKEEEVKTDRKSKGEDCKEEWRERERERESHEKDKGVPAGLVRTVGLRIQRQAHRTSARCFRCRASNIVAAFKGWLIGS